MELAPGTMLGERLRLLEPLGSGAMGSVWLAEDLSLERKVAVKLIHDAALKRPTALGRFRREATLAGRIASPHVVSVHAHGVTDDGVPYIVMERLEGRSLADEIARAGPMSPEEALAIAEQIGRALSAAHALGVVHRDIKPANVFLVRAPGYERFVKVVDFGIAKQPGAEPSELNSETDLTATGALLGTPRYMSPEQLVDSKDVDEKSDLWALGVIVYQLLTRALPFAGDNLGALALAVSAGAITPLSRRRDDLAPEVVAALDRWFVRALCPQKEGRFASAEELTATLAAAIRGVAPAPVETTDATRDAPLSEAAPTEEAPPPRDDNGAATAPLRVETAEPVSAEPAAPSPSPRRYYFVALAVVAALAAALWLVNRRTPDAEIPPAVASAPAIDTPSAAPSEAPAARPVASSSRSGRLPPEVIQAKIRAHFRAIEQCVQLHPYTRGVIRTLRFVIREDGSLAEVRILELDLSTPELDACMLEKLRSIKFPRPEGGVVTVNYPVVLSSEDAPIDDNACQVSPRCIVEGRCTAKEGRCLAASDADCAISLVCTLRGSCRADKGNCVVGFDDCGPGSPPCRLYGLCDKRGATCAATRDEHCSKATACTRHGLCSAREGICVADDESCARATACRDEGFCGGEGDLCSTTTAGCAASPVCRGSGRCAAVGYRCIAASDAECAAARGCRLRGDCALGKLGECSPTTEEHCRQSEDCKQSGRCKLGGYACVAGE